MKRILSGDTRKVTWIASGNTATNISTAVRDREENVVTSLSMTSSGNGHYYSMVTMPTTAAFYAIELQAVISTKTYKRRIPFQIVLTEVD